MAWEGDEKTWNELLGGIARNVAAVPMIVGLVGLGAGVLVGRSLLDVAGHALRRWPAPKRTERRRAPKPSRHPRP